MVSSDHLKPGAVGQVKATVDTTGKNGYVEKHIAVYSNDPVEPVLTLIVTMDVKKK